MFVLFVFVSIVSFYPCVFSLCGDLLSLPFGGGYRQHDFVEGYDSDLVGVFVLFIFV